MLWNPFEELEALRKAMEEFYSGFGSWFKDRYSMKYPPINIYETDDSVILNAFVPGMKKEDIDITVLGNTVTISGERKKHLPENARVYRDEVVEGSFSRTIKLPVEIKSDEIKASLKNGLLTLVLPKEEKSKVKKIKIE